MEVLLKDVVEACNSEKLWVDLRLGSMVRRVRLRLFVTIVNGDGKSGNMVCGRYGAHKNAKRISRTCNVSFAESDNPAHVCYWMTTDYVKPLVDTHLLQ